MSYETIESKFLASPEKGEVWSLLIRPSDAQWLLVLGHGASTNMRHANLQTIAERLMEVGVATFRYNFPYSESGAIAKQLLFRIPWLATASRTTEHTKNKQFKPAVCETDAT